MMYIILYYILLYDIILYYIILLADALIGARDSTCVCAVVSAAI